MRKRQRDSVVHREGAVEPARAFRSTVLGHCAGRPFDHTGGGCVAAGPTRGQIFPPPAHGIQISRHRGVAKITRRTCVVSSRDRPNTARPRDRPPYSATDFARNATTLPDATGGKRVVFQRSRPSTPRHPVSGQRIEQNAHPAVLATHARTTISRHLPTARHHAADAVPSGSSSYRRATSSLIVISPMPGLALSSPAYCSGSAEICGAPAATSMLEKSRKCGRDFHLRLPRPRQQLRHWRGARGHGGETPPANRRSRRDAQGWGSVVWAWSRPRDRER